MKRFLSAIMAVIGIAAAAVIVYTILHYGAVNMRRVETDAYRWRLEWASRR